MGRHKKATLQHRQRAAAAAVLRPPAHYDSEDEEEDEEAAEFRREAAELLRQKQQQSALPGGLTQARLDQAARMMAGQMGVDRRLAEDALLATAEQHCQDPDEWYNEAGMWLAVQSEVQDEAAKLKEAMEVSLREQQAAREVEAAAPPLALLSEERLRKKFQASVVLKHLSRLGAVLPDWVLFSDRMPLRKMVKHKLVELLRLEADCIKWWPEKGTEKYFEDAAERFCEQLGQAASSSRADGTEVAPAAAGAGEPAAAEPTAAAAAAAAAAATRGSAEPSIAGCAASAAQCPVHVAAADGPSSSIPGVAAAVPPAAVAAPAGAGTSCVAPGRCGSTPEAEAPPEPCNTAAADEPAGDEGGATVGAQAGKRKRQPPARYRSPSPGVSSDARKRQRSTPTAGQAPSKRQASLDCHAAAAKDSSSARRSASLSSASVEDLPAAAAAAPAPDSIQQQDTGKPPHQPQQQQQQQQQQQEQQVQPATAAHTDGGNNPLNAVLSAGERLSQLLEDELRQLRHHVFNMPSKACAVPAIFQTVDKQQADGDGDADSDVELVDIKQPAGGTDIPEPPASPARPPAATPASTPPAGAAAQVQAARAAAAAGTVQEESGTPRGLSPATLTSLYMAGFAGPSSSSLAALGVLGQQQQQQSGQRQGQLGGGQQFRQMQDPDDFEYRASTNEKGTLVIEID